MATATGKRILKTTTNFWLQCAVYEDREITRFLEWNDRYIIESAHDDKRIAFYFQSVNRYMYSLVPGLVQHLGAYRGNFKQGGKIGKNARWSATVNSAQNVMNYDWENEFRNPFISNMKLNYDSISTDQYFKDYVSGKNTD